MCTLLSILLTILKTTIALQNGTYCDHFNQLSGITNIALPVVLIVHNVQFFNTFFLLYLNFETCEAALSVPAALHWSHCWVHSADIFGHIASILFTRDLQT